MALSPAQQLPAPEIVSVMLTDALQSGGIVGLDESVEPDMLNKSFRLANRMISQWQHERYMVYQLVDYSFVSTGASSYTVGAGQNFNINPRPDRLEFAFLRQPPGAYTGAGPQPFDWPLDIMDAHEDYSAIRLKSLGTFSSAVFYNPGFPIGILHPWPIPQATIYELHILCKQTLPQFASMQSQILMPPEYSAALEWCMARRFRAAFQMPPDPTINQLAAQGKHTIRKANTQVPLLRMPRDLPGSRGGTYNYRGDTMG